MCSAGSSSSGWHDCAQLQSTEVISPLRRSGALSVVLNLSQSFCVALSLPLHVLARQCPPPLLGGGGLFPRAFVSFPHNNTLNKYHTRPTVTLKHIVMGESKSELSCGEQFNSQISRCHNKHVTAQLNKYMVKLKCEITSVRRNLFWQVTWLWRTREFLYEMPRNRPDKIKRLFTNYTFIEK